MVQVWYTKDGKRLGSYDHDAAVACCEPNSKSTYLLTAAADGTANVFDIETGKALQTFKHRNPIRHCSWAIGDQMFAVVENPSKAQTSRVVIWAWDPQELATLEEADAVRTLDLSLSNLPANCPFQKAVFCSLNDHILAIHPSGYVSKWTVGDEECVATAQLGDDLLTDIVLTHDRGMALITSKDHKAYLINVESLEIIKTYESDRPLNTGAISPILNHTVLAGGQDKHAVTLTGTSEGQFEIQFWHTIYEEKLETVPGHYGPVNSVALTRDGKIMASGSEDGNIRIYHFDEGYFKCTY
jgi:translation initiation factor 3 subunit I